MELRREHRSISRHYHQRNTNPLSKPARVLHLDRA